MQVYYTWSHFWWMIEVANESLPTLWEVWNNWFHVRWKRMMGISKRRYSPALCSQNFEFYLCTITAFTFWLNQFNPSNKPSPVVAQEGCTYHILSRILVRPSISVTSAGVNAPGRSCLFANINNKQSLISLSDMIRCNSCFASSILSRSCESMTNIRPCVPV